MSQRLAMHVHQRRDITIDLGPVSVTIADGSGDSSGAALSPAAPTSSDASRSSSSKSAKSTKPPKGATSSETSVPSTSFPNLASPSTTSSPRLISSNTATITSTSSASKPSHTAAAATATAASSPNSNGPSPGLVAFVVIVCIAFAGAMIYLVLMRRHAKQREWTFQQHQRIFERFDKSDNHDVRPNTSHTANESIYPPRPATAVDDKKAWPVGTGASVITTGPSVVRKLDWDQGPERRPKSIIEARPKRKPVPPPKEAKRKTFSQYLPYLLPQNHNAEVIELGKAEQQVYQRPIYKPAG